MLLSKIVSKIQERKGTDFKSLTFSVQILELLNKNYYQRLSLIIHHEFKNALFCNIIEWRSVTSGTIIAKFLDHNNSWFATT